ncbi:hypothetical protein L3Q82_023035 [Scortum barcoo]|uniref:Uncharacterized protein n=1 Tax=Scortum barcoo TaxID=214431 RepID=A0ACB8WXJ8_9TELE|nr:hypothetical protein L3Q82_023035 [Scortum barcoo]
MQPERAVLKMKEGNYVTIRLKNNKTPELVAVDRQDGPAVLIERRVVDQRKQMAFCFEIEQTYYLVKVDQAKLKMEMASEIVFSDCHWFVKEDVGGGDHYALQSVAEPGKYLQKIKNRQGYIFILSADITNSATVTDKTIEGSTSNSA